jgi:hypothetical protein
MLTAVMVLRVYLIIRLATYFTRYTKEKAERVCAIYGFQTNTMFVIKAILRDSAYVSVALMFLLFTAMSAYLVFIAERNEREMDDGTTSQSLLDT